jgi:hypothetical protein
VPTSLPELLQLAPPLLFLLAAFFLPGTLALLPLRVGWPAAVALGPAVSLLLFALGTFVLDALNLPWTVTAVAVFLLVPLAGAWLARRWMGLSAPIVPRTTPAVRTAVAAGIAAGAALTCLALLRGMDGLRTASQGWDPIFHGNALAWIRESGRATPWSLNPVYGDGPATYYPAGWHSVVALYPGDLVEAANASALIIGGLIWPIGLAFLASVVLPRHPAVWALTPVLAASFVSFPFSQLLRSGQWPNGLATALTPAVLALILLLLPRRSSAGTSRRWKDLLVMAALAVVVVAGAAAVHPSVVFAVAAGAVPFLLAQGVPLYADALRTRRRLTLSVTAAAAVAGAGVLLVLANSRLLTGVMNYPRPPRALLPDSLALAFFDLPRFPSTVPPVAENFNLAVGVLVILGALAAFALRTAWPLAVSWLIFIGLYVLAAGAENPLRFLSGFWYKDTQRIAPYIAMTGSILAAFAVVVLAGVIAGAATRALGARVAAPARFRAVLGAALAVLAVAALYQGSSHFRAADRIAVAAHNYLTPEKPGSGVLSVGEQDFIERAGALLPRDAVVIGDPFNGETYFYTLTGHRVVYSKLGSPAETEAKGLLRTGFDRLHDDDAVCAAVEEVGATHFYTDEPGGSHGSVSLEVWPGFYGVATGTGFEPVLVEGGRGLYEITACR